MLIPVRCPVCGTPGAAPCGACAGALRRAPSLPAPPGLETCRAVLAYEGVGREIVARLKYRNERAVLHRLAAAMAEAVDAGGVDVVTWPPTTGARRRRRGFDQAALLAGAVARRLGRPCRPLLARGAGPAQTGRSAAARRAGPAFVARRPVPWRVLVVDDVATTGATLAAAAGALRAAGAPEVHAVVAARTPLKGVSAWSDTEGACPPPPGRPPPPSAA